jgi:hypothetical protein
MYISLVTFMVYVALLDELNLFMNPLEVHCCSISLGHQLLVKGTSQCSASED